ILAPEVLLIVPPLIINVPAAVPSALELSMFNVPALSVVPPVNVLAPDNVNSPAPAFINPKPPLITEETVKSGEAAPLATVIVRVAPSEIGALIVADEPLEFVFTFPPSVSVPEPTIDVPVISTDPPVKLKILRSKVPLLT